MNEIQIKDEHNINLTIHVHTIKSISQMFPLHQIHH